MDNTLDQYVGRTNVIQNVDQRLGEVGFISDISGTGNSPRILNSGCPVRVRIVRNDSGGTLAKSTVVKWKAGSEGLEIGATAGSLDIGCGIVDPFLTTTVADGHTFLLFQEGPALVLSSAAISAGAFIVTAANGKVVTRGAMDDVGDAPIVMATVGRLVVAASADAQYRRAFLKFLHD